MAKQAAGVGLQEEFGLEDDDDVTMPNARSYRAGASLLHWYGNTRSGCRTLQDFKKISILEVKGYCYGWHFYRPPTPTSSSRPTTPCSAMPRSATSARRRACGSGR